MEVMDNQIKDIFCLISLDRLCMPRPNVSMMSCERHHEKTVNPISVCHQPKQHRERQRVWTGYFRSGAVDTGIHSLQ